MLLAWDVTNTLQIGDLLKILLENLTLNCAEFDPKPLKASWQRELDHGANTNPFVTVIELVTYNTV